MPLFFYYYLIRQIWKTIGLCDDIHAPDGKLKVTLIATLICLQLGDLQSSYLSARRAVEAYPDHKDSQELLKQLRQHFSLLWGISATSFPVWHHGAARGRDVTRFCRHRYRTSFIESFSCCSRILFISREYAAWIRTVVELLRVVLMA